MHADVDSFTQDEAHTTPPARPPHALKSLTCAQVSASRSVIHSHPSCFRAPRHLCDSAHTVTTFGSGDAGDGLVSHASGFRKPAMI